MKKMIILALTLISVSSAFSAENVEVDKEICGSLTYKNGSYALLADHEDNYIVREEKLHAGSFAQTKLMRIIVQNHDYNVSDFPQVCFYDVTSERVGNNELDVLAVGDVQLRRFVR